MTNHIIYIIILQTHEVLKRIGQNVLYYSKNELNAILPYSYSIFSARSHNSAELVVNSSAAMFV